MNPLARRTRQIAKVLTLGIGICGSTALASGLLSEACDAKSAQGQALRWIVLAAIIGLMILGFVHLVWLVSVIQCARAFGRRVGKLPDPAWAAVSYFVPIASLFVPYRHLRTLRDVSDPSDLEVPGEGRGGRRNRSKARSAPVLGWWIAYIVAQLLAGLVITKPSIPAIAEAFFALLWIRVIGGITAGFVERARRVEAGAISLDDDDGHDDDDDEGIQKRRARAARRQAARRIDASV